MKYSPARWREEVSISLELSLSFISVYICMKSESRLNCFPLPIHMNIAISLCGHSKSGLS